MGTITDVTVEDVSRKRRHGTSLEKQGTEVPDQDMLRSPLRSYIPHWKGHVI